MEWTTQQKKAIDERNKNLLVSAAAGSGKTAVLIERIKTLILNEGVSVDQFLIVTFTNAASADMRAKLVSAINKHISDNPDDARMMKRQLSMVYRANISTFHAFCLEVIRRYFYITDVDPNFKICDDAEAAILRGEAMDRLFETEFEECNPEFITFLKCYSGSKNEKKIREMILDMYNNISSVPDPEQWYNTFVDGRRALAQADAAAVKKEFCESGAFAFIVADMDRSMETVINSLQSLKDFLEEVKIGSIAKKTQEEIHNAAELRRILQSNGPEEFLKALMSQTTVRYVASKAEKEDYEEIKEQVQKLRKLSADRLAKIKKTYGGQSLDEHVQDMIATYPYERFLTSLVKKFGRLYGEAKAEKNLVDFSDIEHYALKILSQEAVAAEYRQKFRYIFVDEYQDSNGLQEALLNCIRRPDNLFMVGDVKQSIYKFRLAEPELFLKRYEDYKHAGSESHENIDMNKNFRSSETVIETVNNVFEALMPGYDDNAKLHLGVNNPKEYLYPSKLYIAHDLNNMEGDSELFELEKEEYEAIAAAQIIRSAMKDIKVFRRKEVHDENGHPVLDENGNVKTIEVVRDLRYSDIAILMKSTKNAAAKYQKILMNYDIPLYIEDNDGYFDTLEIDVFVNLLRVIDNRRQDVPLVAVLYSEIFDFSASDLAKIRIQNKKGSFFDAFSNYSQLGTEEKLKTKCRHVLQRLEEWRAEAADMPLDEFIWKVMWETGYYNYTGALPAGEQRQANLRVLVDRAIQFQSSHMNGIYSFVQYIDSVKSRGALASQVSLSGENDDVVRMMTIHKSKGLEFPMVIVAGLGQKFNVKTNKKGVCIHRDMGIALRRVEYESHWYKTTLLQDIIERKKQHEELEEEVRVLYVAMTRAMDYLVMLGTEKIDKTPTAKLLSPETLDVDSTGCFLDMIEPKMAIDGIFFGETLFTQGSMELGKMLETIQAGKRHERPLEDTIAHKVIKGMSIRPDNHTQDEINFRLNYKYENDKGRSLKSKYTVTELNEASAQGEHAYERKLAVPSFMQEKAILTPGEKGTAMHTAAEKLDFRMCTEALTKGEECIKETLEKFMEKLVRDMVLLPIEAESVSIDALAGLIKSPIGRRIALSENVRRELPFTMKHIYEENEVMVQGVIDCCFEEDGKYVIVDYKTNFMKDDSPEETDRLKNMYAGQLELYKKALESIWHVDVKEAYLYLFDISRELKVF